VNAVAVGIEVVGSLHPLEVANAEHGARPTSQRFRTGVNRDNREILSPPFPLLPPVEIEGRLSFAERNALRLPPPYAGLHRKDIEQEITELTEKDMYSSVSFCSKSSI
jgi:hypothetical protein